MEGGESEGMKAIPIAMRERILKLYEQGKSSIEIAEFSGFCVAAVCRVRQQFKERGTINGSPVWNFNDGLMAAAAGVEL